MMKCNSIGSILFLTLGVMLSALLPCSGQRNAELPADATVEPSRTIPIMYISTADGKPVVSKEEYKRATFYITDPAEEVSLGTATAPLEMNIRGRGHSSWKADKKPYRLKLDEKLSLLGMPKSKHWALLKFWAPTMAGMKLGELIGMAWTPSTRPIEVVLNGEYIGLYLLTETIRIAKSRVNIYEQPDLNEEAATIPGGWLVEVDNYREDNQIRFRENDRWIINITHHSPKRLSTAQKEWLTAEFKGLNSDIYAPDKATSRWEERIDVDAMARFFIIQEVMDNPDGFHGSFYLHKDLGEDSKWVAGPIWDLTCMNREKTDYTFRMTASYVFAPHWIGELLKDDDFNSAVGKVWQEVYPTLSNEWLNYLEKCFAPYEAAYRQDKLRWAEAGVTTQPLHSVAEKLTTSLRRNVDWFNAHLPATPNAITPVVLTTDGRHIVYTMSGEVVRISDDYDEAIRDLPQGVYIVGGHKVVVP